MITERYSRQAFLGSDAQALIEAVTIGVVGLGGGGSHVVQQLAHIGFKHYALFDADTVDESNLNRLVGATLEDEANRAQKIDVAQRVISGLHSDAEVSAHQSRWQEAMHSLRRCDIVFGCVDSYQGREELERFTRRHLMPYIDIGMDIVVGRDNKPVMGGQVILSLPGHACMRCIGFLTDERLEREAQKYGVAGPKPQVVWPNGVLASTAVGIAVDLITNWSENTRGSLYIQYDGNRGLLKHTCIKIVDDTCTHFPPDQVGEPVFREV